MVNGFGLEAGKPLASSRRIAKIAFTGETTTGRLIMQYASQNLIPVTLELGGKSPNVFFEDVMAKDDDFFDKALEGFTMFALNQGEVCTCPSRALIQESIYDRFMEQALARVKKVKQGNPLDTDTMIGAQASTEQLEKILSYIDIGKQEGAKVLIGGGRNVLGGDLTDGYYVKPTVLQGHNKMRVFQEEIFGPVVAVTTFKDEAEALAIANDTLYGLGAGVWSRDGNTAYRMGRGIQAGRVWTNCYHLYPAHAAFGGYKGSGIGRENHKMMLSHYQQTKNLLVSATRPRRSASSRRLPPRRPSAPRRRHRGRARADRAARAQHGPLIFHQSGGCCDGSSPMCYPRGELIIGDSDRLLGEIGGQPFYIGAAQFEYWRHTQLVIDVVPGRGGMFSLEDVEGVRFLTRSRVFTDEEYGALRRRRGGRSRPAAVGGRAGAVRGAAARARTAASGGRGSSGRRRAPRRPGPRSRRAAPGAPPGPAARGRRRPARRAGEASFTVREISAGRCEARISFPEAMAAARRITFCSCRTLPGQVKPCSAATASSDRRSPVRPTSASACSRKAWASSGMSSTRCRSGGMARESTSSR